jgi:uncharacterized membrane protein required for colicin V production
MTNVDIVLLVCCAIGAGLGYYTGLAGMLVYLVCLGLGYVVYPDVYGWTEAKIATLGLTDSQTGTIALFLTWIPLLVMAGILASLSRKIFRVMMVNWLNQSLGGLTGLVIAVLALMPLCLFAAHYPVEDPWVSADMKAQSPVFSVFYGIGKYLLGRLLENFLPGLLP